MSWGSGPTSVRYGSQTVTESPLAERRRGSASGGRGGPRTRRCAAKLTGSVVPSRQGQLMKPDADSLEGRAVRWPPPGRPPRSSAATRPTRAQRGHDRTLKLRAWRSTRREDQGAGGTRPRWKSSTRVRGIQALPVSNASGAGAEPASRWACRRTSPTVNASATELRSRGPADLGRSDLQLAPPGTAQARQSRPRRASQQAIRMLGQLETGIGGAASPGTASPE